MARGEAARSVAMQMPVTTSGQGVDFGNSRLFGRSRSLQFGWAQVHSGP
jgi:hypothetical protein